MPQLFGKRRYLLYALSVVALLFIEALFVSEFRGIKVLQELIWSGSDFRLPPMRRAQSIIPPYVTMLLSSVVIILLDLGREIAAKWFISQQREAELKSENIAAQLSNLQNQVSPHFFMNTLNNIYAMVKMGSPKAADSVMELSGLMDYLLYESANSKSVSLKREAEFIESYVNLMRLRYPERVVIEFNYSDDIPAVTTAPLLALNFIENAFKYGVDYTKESFIRIGFEVNDEEITISVVNSNHSDTVKCTRRGLGIPNSRKRLDLIYGNRYSLDISEQIDIYSVTLKIPTAL